MPRKGQGGAGLTSEAVWVAGGSAPVTQLVLLKLLMVQVGQHHLVQ
jgi:hypothetical protein